MKAKPLSQSVTDATNAINLQIQISAKLRAESELRIMTQWTNAAKDAPAKYVAMINKQIKLAESRCAAARKLTEND